MSKPPVPSESDVERAILDLLACRGFKVYTQRAGSVKSARGGWMRLAPRGASDLTGWHRGTGRALQVEVKRPGERPTQEQGELCRRTSFDVVRFH